jgi:mannose-1-phosphate guanylyltransferase
VKENPDAEMIVTPADHLILNEIEFSRVVESSLEFIRYRNALMTIGIQPTRPETGYGYIQKSNLEEICKVKCFTEKPNREMAEAFLECGEFLWNSGIFIWKVRDIIEAFEKHLPNHAALFSNISELLGTAREEQAIAEVFSECRAISIDYGVMEMADNVYVHCGDFGWSDVGTWGSIYQHSRKDKYANAMSSDKIKVYDTRNSLITIPEEKIAVVSGLKDYIVVDTPDVLMICPMSDEQNIKSFIEDVKFDIGDKHI